MQAEKVEIIVDERKIQVQKNGNLIDELKKHNIEIPHFCYHPALGVSGNCRMCLVEIVGQKRPQIACDTPISEGMEIKINSELTRKVQRGLLELEFINHPLDCPICDQAGECALQEYYMKHDLGDSRALLNEKVQKDKRVDLGSGVIHDEERCVLCRRCVRFTQKCTKTNELGVSGRGEHSHISLFANRTLHNDYAGNIADICPVGAMTLSDFRFKKRVWHLKRIKAICQGCARGCAVFADFYAPKDEAPKIYRFNSRPDSMVNGHFICDFGRYSYKKEQLNLNINSINDIEKIIAKNNSTIEKLREFLRVNRGDFAVLVSSFLSLEEMNAAKIFAEHFGAEIFGFNDYLDTGFCDGNCGELNLKVADKSPNSKGMEYLQISRFNSNLKNKKFIVFDLGNLEKIKALNLDAFYISSDEKADIICAGAFWRNGHTINCDGILRFSQGIFEKIEIDSIDSMQKNPLAQKFKRPLFTIIEIIEKVCEKTLNLKDFSAEFKAQKLQGEAK